MSKTRDRITREQVQEMETRTQEMRERIQWVRSRIAEVSVELGRLRADGRGDAPEATPLRDERRTLTEEMDELTAALPLLEERIRNGRTAVLAGEARRRLTAIKRAHGSLCHEVEGDQARVTEAVDGLASALERSRDRREKLARLELEATLLALRFDQSRPELSPTPPATEAPHLRATAALARRPDLPPPFSAPHRASADEGEKRLERLRAVERFLQHLPIESPGANLLREAGPAPAITRKREARERQRLEREAQEAASFEGVAGEVKRAMAASWAQGAALRQI